MTLQMILALTILVIMIVLIMTDALPFGAPPLLACCLLVVAGSIFGGDWETAWDISYAFAGFTNKTVWMIAFFMVVVSAAQKTTIVTKLRHAMLVLMEKGGFKSYILLILIVMAGASIIGSATGYYVLVLSVLSTIPYNKSMPASKLILPVGFATQNPIVPVNVAIRYGVAVSVLETAGYAGVFSMTSYAAMTGVASLGFLIWAIVGYRLLPDHDVNGSADDKLATVNLDGESLPKWKENLTVLAFLFSVAGMMMSSQIGAVASVFPGLAAFMLLAIKVVDFKEMRGSIFSPIILMMAGVIPVANALADSGLTSLIGNTVAGFVGSDMPVFFIILLFAFLTSICATFTGSNMGSVFVFAPFAIATCVALGYNPCAAAAAVTLAGWSGGFMPIDGLPAIALGMGNYTLGEFWKFTVPMYILKIIAMSAGAVLLFPL